MKCNKCGADFGEGLYCQHCGIDRVEGLGSFHGLHPNAEASSDQTHGSTTPGGISISRTDSMLCFSCGEIIPGEAEYCPYCKISQYVICPKCGLRYLAQYPNCYKCGTNRNDYLKQQENEQEERRRKEAEARRKAEETRREEEEKRRREEEARRAREIQRQKEVHRETKNLDIPQSQGGRKVSLVVASRPYHSPRIIWFETTDGRAISSPFESSREEFHFNTILYYSRNSIGIAYYCDGVLYSLLEPEGHSVSYAYKASELVPYDSGEADATRLYEGEPYSSSGFYKIDNYYFSLDDHSVCYCTKKRSYNGLSVPALVGICILIGLFGWGAISTTSDSLAALFGMSNSGAVGNILGVIISLVAIVALVVINSRDHITTVCFHEQSNDGERDYRNNNTSNVEITDSSIVHKLSPKQRDLYESAIVYLENLAVDLQHEYSDFNALKIDSKLSCLEWTVSRKLITDQQVSRVVDFVIKDRDYWEKPDCLKSMNLGNEVLKIINSVNV